MNTNNVETLKTLLSKLSAVRMTLSDEEQTLLDQLLTSPSGEVGAHRIRIVDSPERFVRDADEVEAHRIRTYGVDEAKIREADEVEAHRIRTFDVDEAKVREADEVEAHRLNRGAADEAKVREADEVEAHSRPYPEDSSWVEIYFDLETESYDIQL